MKSWNVVMVIAGLFLASTLIDLPAQSRSSSSRSSGSSKPSGSSSSRSSGSSKPSGSSSSRSSGSSKPSGSSSSRSSGSSKPSGSSSSRSNGSSSGSSKPPSSRSSSPSASKYSSPNSSKPLTPSRPSSPPVSKYSSPSSKSAVTNNVPKYSSPNSSKPSTSSKPSAPVSKYSSPNSSKPTVANTAPKSSTSNSSKPTVTTNTPKYSSPNSQPPVSKYSSPNVAPKAVVTVPLTNSFKPNTTETAESRVNKTEASRKAYVAQQAATAPPKSTYTTTTGKTVKVDTSSVHVAAIRSKPSTYHQPDVRKQRYETHFHHYHYNNPPSYYYSQPYYHVGGGYSSLFWYMMMDWSAERRAMWLYHNQDRIDQAAYQQAMRDTDVAARLKALEQQQIRRDANYVDPEFRDNPADMYDQEYVEAAYNPQVVTHPIAVADTSVPVNPVQNTTSSGSSFGFVVFLLVVIVGFIILIWAMFNVKFGN